MIQMIQSMIRMIHGMIRMFLQQDHMNLTEIQGMDVIILQTGPANLDHFKKVSCPFFFSFYLQLFFVEAVKGSNVNAYVIALISV